MYGIILEIIRRKRSKSMCDFSHKSVHDSKLVADIEKGKIEPSHSYLLDFASFYSIPFSDLKRLNNMDDLEAANGKSISDRYKLLKEIIKDYYDNEKTIVELVDKRNRNRR